MVFIGKNNKKNIVQMTPLVEKLRQRERQRVLINEMNITLG
jgi:hypothetical protein